MLLEQKEGRVIFYLKVTANAGHTGIVGITTVHDRMAFKAQVNAVRERGKANQALIDYLSDFLKTPKKNIMIDSGETQPFKKIMILNMSLDEVKHRFKALGFLI